MTQDSLLTLQLRYARARYNQELHRCEAEALEKELFAAARLAAIGDLEALPTRSEPTTSAMYRMGLERGIYTRVAAALGLGTSGRAHVSRVANGSRTSPRVQEALNAERERINREVELYESSLGKSAVIG